MNPTLAEEAPLTGPALARDRKGGVPFAIVGLVFAVLLALGFTLALVIHRRYVGFERIAARHVPPDTALALRWDVEKVSLFEPTRRFLLPLLDATRSDAPAAPTRRQHLAEAAKLEIGRDLREAVVLFGPGPGEWALVLAGSFPEGDVLAPTLAVLGPEGARADGPGRIVTPDGIALARASDGAFILAANASRLDAVLASREPPAGIARTGAGSLLLHADRSGLPVAASELLRSLGDVTEVQGQATWGSPLRVELTLRFRHDPPADVRERVRRAFATLFGADAARLEQQFGRLDVQSAGNQAVRVQLSLDDTALQQAVDRASRAVVSELALRPALD